ncbi:MAG TPA: hypothetical protein VM051_00230 [Usitatibacter sp.]|nr:hypothetical protein [Usitatibacter sp.]
MPILETAALLLAGLAYLTLLGYPVVRLTLPEDLREEYSHVIAPGVGYMVLCLFAFALSGGARIGAPAASLIVSAVMAAATVVLVVRDWRRGRLRGARVRARVLQMAILIIPLEAALLWPFFVNGADTYLGAVNPDYFAGLVDDYFLQKGHSVADFTKGRDTFHPLDYLAGSISSSGRFASGLLAIAFSKMTGLDLRTTLTLSIALFMSCLPLAMYFFSRVVFGLDRAGARMAAWLIGISTPVAMSYLYFYLGQNSGLAALPLTLAAGFLLLTRPDARLVVLFTLLVNALLVVYLGMLPYAVAPLGILGLYLLAKRRLSWKWLGLMLAGFAAVSLAVNFAMLPSLYAMVRGWSNVIGQTLQGQYFLDFLTEAFFPMFLGAVIYPLKTSWYYAVFQPEAVAATMVAAVTILVGLAILWFAWRWLRQSDPVHAVTVMAAIAIYAAVWWVYSFQRQYGYAVFKMSSWLQFMVVPFVAYAWMALRSPGPGAPVGWKRAAFAAGFALYVVANFVGTIEYGMKGMGNTVARAYIVNSFQMSGNRDYFELAGEVRRHLGKDESVGLAFVDSIQNFWVAYYLRDQRISLLAHENIPGDDENLPDVMTNKLVDYYGNVREANNVFFHGAEDQYYLTWNESHLNHDIVEPRFSAEPVWKDRTFRLFRAADNPDMVFSGRGFYRMEYETDRTLKYWWPERSRWSAQGGEVYLLRPAAPGTPRRIAFDLIVGYEHRDDARNVELWANQVKFDEIRITSAGRYVSKPFVPAADVTKIVIKIRERVPPGKRPLPLWNRDIPLDYRQLNALLSNIRVLREGESVPQPAGCPRALRGTDILRCPRAYNGVQIDGWIGRKASLVMVSDTPARKAVMKGFVPGTLGFTFPYRITFNVNGAETVSEVAKPGDFTLEIPLAAAAGEVAIDIVPAQASDRTEEFSVRHKLVTQAVRLDSVELQ